MKTNLKNNQAFSLIELMIAVLIVSVVSGIIIIGITNSGAKNQVDLNSVKVFDMTVKNKLAENIVGEWSFDEGSGTTAINSTDYGSALNGTITGATYQASSNCISNSCLLFGVASSYVSTPITQSFSAVTVSVWVKTSNVSYSRDGTGIQEIISKWAIGNKSWDFRMNSGAVNVAISPGGDNNGENEISTHILVSNEWTHLAFTYDDVSDTVVIYKNGIGQSFVNSITMGGSTAMQIGRLTWGDSTDRNWNGSMDQACIYNAALTISQIQEQYRAGLD
ncbi:MAG: LamG domain-containing protein, partial [Candidatus Paceibacterota bacterium]